MIHMQFAQDYILVKSLSHLVIQSHQAYSQLNSTWLSKYAFILCFINLTSFVLKCASKATDIKARKIFIYKLSQCVPPRIYKH